jgi:hypothetical protein
LAGQKEIAEAVVNRFLTSDEDEEHEVKILLGVGLQNGDSMKFKSIVQ